MTCPAVFLFLKSPPALFFSRFHVSSFPPRGGNLHLALYRFFQTASVRTSADTGNEARATPAIKVILRTSHSMHRLLLRTLPLHELHQKHGARFVDFAGYTMPLVYKDQTQIQSHLHTRAHASIFDVSHMLQTKWTGAHHLDFLNSIMVTDLSTIPEKVAKLTLFLNAEGGIKDDAVVQRPTAKETYLVTNAGCRSKDLEHFERSLQAYRRKSREPVDVNMNIMENGVLLAIQGPEAAQSLSRLFQSDRFLTLPFMHSTPFRSALGLECWVTRCGYTGEDGFELSFPRASDAQTLVEQLLDRFPQQMRLAGLAVRDTLRLEAGLCLYGQDLDEGISPLEAQLQWCVSKTKAATYLGKAKLEMRMHEKKGRQRVGIRQVVEGGKRAAPFRSGDVIYLWQEGGPWKCIGHVTSGLFSPTLEVPIAMGYVPSLYTLPGTLLCIAKKRSSAPTFSPHDPPDPSKLIKAVVVKLPFVEHRYFKSALKK